MKRSAVTMATCGAAALAAMLSGCVPPAARHPHQAALKPVARLDCPDSEGQLTRTAAAADGKSCNYTGGNDIQVKLTLTPVNGDPSSTLAPIEASLHQMATFDPDQSAAPPASSTAGWADGSDGRHHDKNVNIDLPGMHIHTTEAGKAEVNVAGIHVNADDRTKTAHVESQHGSLMGHGGGFTVDANASGAIIRSQSMGPDVRASLILASDKPGPEGWHVVGYEAEGPKSGPLVIALVQSRANEHDQLFEDVRALVRKSAGG